MIDQVVCNSNTRFSSLLLLFVDGLGAKPINSNLSLSLLYEFVNIHCQCLAHHHHHHQVTDLEQTLATMPLQTSLSSDNFKKIKPLLCPPVAELQRLSRNVIRCLPLSRLPSTLPVKDKNSKPLRLHTCPKNSICLFLIVFNSDL